MFTVICVIFMITMCLVHYCACDLLKQNNNNELEVLQQELNILMDKSENNI